MPVTWNGPFIGEGPGGLLMPGDELEVPAHQVDGEWFKAKGRKAQETVRKLQTPVQVEAD